MTQIDDDALRGLVARLRVVARLGENPYAACRDAAGAIDALMAEVIALRAKLAEVAWQPIETAPRGTTIDIWIANSYGTGRRIAECYYDHICDEWRTSSPALRLYCVKARCVTHWMPLPIPPTDEARGKIGDPA